MSNTRHLKSRGGSSRTILAPTLFGRLPAPLQARLKKQAPRRKFPAGALIQQVGDGASGFWLIEQGTVQIGVFRADGDFRAVGILEEGDSYGELALMGRSKRVADAIARVPSELLWIDGSRFEEAISEDPAIMRDLVGAMALELQEMIGFISGFRGGSAQNRVASVVANAARHTAEPAVLLTQSEIADLAGVTRATAAAALRAFERKGAVKRRYGMIEVCDRALLQELSF